MSGSFVLVSGIWKQSMSINEWTAKQIIVNTDNGVWLSGREGKGLVHTRTWMHFKLLCCAKEGRNRRVQMVPFYEILGTEKPSTVTESRAVVVGAGKIGVLTAKNWGRIVGDRNVLFSCLQMVLQMPASIKTDQNPDPQPQMDRIYSTYILLFIFKTIFIS